jgi:hypothetical protein
MKTWFRHGLSVLAGLTFSVAALAAEPTPIEDRDAFEKQYIDCVEGGLKDKCFSALFLSHLDPITEEGRKSLNQLDGIYQAGVAYKVHPLDKVMRAGVVDCRTYLIEQPNGDFVGASVTFRKSKGKWYVFAFLIDGSNEFVKKLLKLPTDQ